MDQWQSNDKWEFKIDDRESWKIFIVNTDYEAISVLGNLPNGTIWLKSFDEGDSSQKWTKGEPDKEGYYTLTSQSTWDLLTAISSSELAKRIKLPARKENADAKECIGGSNGLEAKCYVSEFQHKPDWNAFNSGDDNKVLSCEIDHDEYSEDEIKKEVNVVKTNFRLAFKPKWLCIQYAHKNGSEKCVAKVDIPETQGNLLRGI